MKIIDYAKRVWNREADEHNQWYDLSEDEKLVAIEYAHGWRPCTDMPQFEDGTLVLFRGDITTEFVHYSLNTYMCGDWKCVVFSTRSPDYKFRSVLKRKKMQYKVIDILEEQE